MYVWVNGAFGVCFIKAHIQTLEFNQFLSLIQELKALVKICSIKDAPKVGQVWYSLSWTVQKSLIHHLILIMGSFGHFIVNKLKPCESFWLDEKYTKYK